MKKFILIAVSALIAAACVNDKDLKLIQVEPFEKILYTDSTFVEVPDTICVARGENATFQFVLLSDKDVSDLKATVDAGALELTYSGWVHDVHNENHSSGADDLITTPENNYPDPVLDDFDESISAGDHRTLRVDVAAGRQTKPGLYKCKLIVEGNGKDAKASKKFYVKVYPVTLPEEQSLTVVNWTTDSGLKYLNGGVSVEYGSEKYFELLKIVAKTLAANGQNCWLMPRNPEVVLNDSKDGFVLDFTNYSKVLETLKEYGNLKYFCNPHFGSRPDEDKWSEEFLFNMCTVQDGELVWTKTDYRDPRLKEFIDSYYSQFEAYLREKDLLGCCYQHIADEPDFKGSPSQISYSAVAGMVKEAAPSLRIIDACHEIAENQDVSVVLLSKSIATLPAVPEGAERWMYTCCAPRGNFANRFVQQPLIKTRILHWINYKYNECGYLHWGFNYWYFSSDPLKDITPNGRPYWPGGDCFIAYPGDNKIYPSMRLGAMRDGVRDYDLLKMVEAKDPAKAKEFCDSIVLGPDKYNTDPRHFRAVRTQMLEFLSE